jgi:hypothetical protein
LALRVMMWPRQAAFFEVVPLAAPARGQAPS